MLVLELPTGGLADAVGRRPVLIIAAVIAVVVRHLFVSRRRFLVFVGRHGLQGVFRALDSGPLEAWYVDTAHAEDQVARWSRASAGPARSSAGHRGRCAGLGGPGRLGTRWAGPSPLVLPFLVAIALSLVHLVLTAVLVREPPGGTAGRVARHWSARPARRPAVADGVRLLRHCAGAALPGAGRGLLGGGA